MVSLEIPSYVSLGTLNESVGLSTHFYAFLFSIYGQLNHLCGVFIPSNITEYWLYCIYKHI